MDTSVEERGTKLLGNLALLERTAVSPLIKAGTKAYGTPCSGAESFENAHLGPFSVGCEPVYEMLPFFKLMRYVRISGRHHGESKR